MTCRSRRSWYALVSGGCPLRRAAHHLCMPNEFVEALRSLGRARFIVLLAGACGGAALKVCVIVQIGRLVQVLLKSDGLDAQVVSPIFLLIATLATQAILVPLFRRWQNTTERQVTADIRRRVTHSMLSISPYRLASPDLREPNVQMEESKRRGGVHETIPAMSELLELTVLSVVCTTLMMRIDSGAALAVLAGWLLSMWVSWRTVASQSGFLRGASQRQDLARAQYLRDVATSPTFAKDVRLFGLQSWTAYRYSSTWTSSMSRLWDRRRQGLGIAVAAVTVVGLSHLWFVSRLMTSGISDEVPLSSLVVAGQSLFVLAALGTTSDRIAAVAAGVRWHGSAWRLIGAALHQEPGTPHTNLCKSEIAVCLNDITVMYPGADRAAIQGLDLAIQRGERLALVGANGSGKSTLLRLVCGLLPGTTGQIKVFDSTPLRWLGTRTVCGTVQDATIYPFTLLGNVSSTGDYELVGSALDQVGLNNLVTSLPDGLKSLIGPDALGARNVSGGQRQMIAVSRVLAGVKSGAELAVLDEPTAQLHPDIERNLFDMLWSLPRTCTVVLATHRLAGVRAADRIVVLDQGSIAEQGTFDQLMRAGTLFHEMYRKQESQLWKVADEEVAAR